MREQPTTIAILGAGALAEDILARLLEREGYSTRVHEAHPIVLTEGSLDGVDVVLFAPGLDSQVREAFLEAMSTTPQTAAIPVLPLSSALRMALLDELAGSAPWRTLFEELVGQIRAALARAASSAGALVVEGSGAQPPPATPQAGAP